MEPAIGLLGLGFLGRTLAGLGPWSPLSWGTCRPHSYPEILRQQPFPVIPFEWTDPTHWGRLPARAVTLVVTIPPLRDLRANETQLQQWGAWMQEHRPMCQRLLYVSTTGVYPQQAGLWSEEELGAPDTLSGQLRLQTEDLLRNFFHLQVVRPGGIYGPGRNLWLRLLQGQPMPTSPHQPTHRVHVEDLARLLRLLILHPELPNCVNAVDNEALPSLRVAQWCAEQRPELISAEQRSVLAEPDRLHPFLNRQISNQRLHSTGMLLRYPTFREGYLSLLEESPNQSRA